MKLEEQVLSIEQARCLQKLGLDMSDGCFIWNINPDTKEACVGVEYINEQCSVYTYTLQRIKEILPSKIKVDNEVYKLTGEHNLNLAEHWDGFGYSRKNYVRWVDNELFEFIDYFICYRDGNSLNNAYDLLCWTIRNGYLITKETK